MNLKTDFIDGIKHSFGKENIFYTFLASFTIFALLIVLSSPGSILQSARFSLGLLPDTLKLILLANIQSGMFLPSSLYSLLLGAIVINMIKSFKVQNSSLENTLAAIPGIAAAGCGGCGVGLLAFFGFAGALSLLPFGGNELYAVGIAVLALSIARIGDPTVCDV